MLFRSSAVCVSDAAEVLELADPFGVGLAENSSGNVLPGQNQPVRADHDDLAVEDILLLDALPLRSGSPVEKLAMVAGLGIPAVRAGLARLELMGLARCSGSGLWRRAGR